jgi:hypothetical protein
LIRTQEAHATHFHIDKWTAAAFSSLQVGMVSTVLNSKKIPIWYLYWIFIASL